MVKIKQNNIFKNITYGQLGSKHSSWPPLKGLRPSIPSLPCHFLWLKQKQTAISARILGFPFRFAENRIVEGSSPGKQSNFEVLTYSRIFGFAY